MRVCAHTCMPRYACGGHFPPPTICVLGSPVITLGVKHLYLLNLSGPILFFDAGSLIGLELSKQASLAGHESQWFTFLHIINVGIAIICHGTCSFI